MTGKRQRHRKRAIEQQENFCFFCWSPMLPSYLDLEDSACLVSLDPPGAPWKAYMHWPRFVAAHVRCGAEFNDMRQPGTVYAVAGAGAPHLHELEKES